MATDCEQYLHERLTLLEAQLATVNRMAAANDLPDAIITESGLKDHAAGCGGARYRAGADRPDSHGPAARQITELLLEVDECGRASPGTSTHLKSGDLAKDKNLLLTTIWPTRSTGPDQDGRVLPRHDLREARLAASHGNPRRNVLDSVG